MPMIAAPVAIWVGGAATTIGVTAATAATVGAIAGAVAVGVVSGAVIGAATAAISGGNILDGALKGAIVGGVSAGVISGLGMATGLATSSDQLASMGVNSTATGPLAAPVTPSATSGITKGTYVDPDPTGSAAKELINIPTKNTGSGSALNTVGGSGGGTQETPGALSKLFLNSEGNLSDATGKIIAGGVEGVAQAYATKQPDLPAVESQSEYLAKVQGMNTAGTFENKVANIKVPNYWKRYTGDPAENVNPTVNPIAAPAGVSYA